jgi:hypothetical protein
MRKSRLVYNFGRIPVLSRSQAGIQAKLAVNAPGDIYEQEAYRVADLVMAAPVHNISSASPRIQRLAGSSGGQMATPASVDKGPGQPRKAAGDRQINIERNL